MKKTMHHSLLLLSLLSLGAYAQNDSWYGTYKYEAVLGENAADTPVTIEYKFQLGENICKVSSKGYQTDEEILCDAKWTENTLKVKFKSFADGSIENIYGVTVYPVNEVLFTFTLSAGKIITTWGSFSPDESSSTGHYFIKLPSEAK